MNNNFYFNQKRNVWDKHYKDYYYGAYGSNLNKRQMSHRCPLAKPAGTAIIRDKQLCFRGVADLEYKKDETDTRLKHVFLTNEGTKLFNEIFSIQKKRIYEAFSKLDSRDILSFDKVLNKIINEKF